MDEFLTNGNVAIRQYMLGNRRRWHIIFRSTDSELVISEEDFRALQNYDMDSANHPSMGWSKIQL